MQKIDIKDKFCLTLEEATVYFNIGEKKLRQIVSENPNSGFIVRNGVKTLIKRKKFEKFIDDTTDI